MRSKYDPNVLMMEIALLNKMAGKMSASVDGTEDFKDYQIEIELKGQEQKPLIIRYDSYLKVGPLLISQGDKVFSEDILEKRKDDLGRVMVYYRGQKYASFDNFSAFIKQLCLDD